MTPTSRVVVVGAGIAGVSAAWALAEDHDVVLVETEPQPGAHATGRSAAVLSETSGLAPVCALAAASRPFFEAPSLPIDPPLSPRGLLWVGTAESAGALAATAESARRLGIEVAELDSSDARELVPVLRDTWMGSAVLEPEAMSIDVAALLAGFIGAARDRGAAVRLGTRAVRCERRGDGWRVACEHESIDCDAVVNAAGAWADELARRSDVPTAGLQPYRRTAFTFPVPDAARWPLVMDVASAFYFEPEGPGLLVSPAEETPVDPHDARADELAMARVVDALGESTTLVVRGVTSKWAGLRTFAPDRLPVVGEDDTAPGFFWLAGQGGAGIKTAPALARLVAAQVASRPVPIDVVERGVTATDFEVGRLRR